MMDLYNKFLFSIIITFALLSVIQIITIHLALAQNVDVPLSRATPYLTFQHPSGWYRELANTEDHILVYLAPPVNFSNPSNQSRAAIGIYGQVLPDGTITDNQKLLAYTYAQLEFLNKNFRIISVNETNLLGSPAYQVVFTANQINVSCVWTVKNSHVYMLIYAANKDNYSNYFPVFQQTIKTLRYHPQSWW